MRLVNDVILTFIGKPKGPSFVLTETGHGDSAYVCTQCNAIIKLFESLSLWGSYSKTFVDGDGNIYMYYEMDCNDRKFLKSETFKRICRPYHVNISICETHEDIEDILSNLKHI